jgi:hypothetical protein
MGSNALATWSDKMANLNSSSPDASATSYGYLATYSLLQLVMALFTAFNLLVFIVAALRVSV